MSDFDFVDEASGASGDLAKGIQVCVALNSNLTGLLDAIEGPDGTDTFDASCNTCKHFVRARFDKKEHNPAIFGFPGSCAQTGDAATGWPRGQYVGMKCYENRRTGKKANGGKLDSLAGNV